jgi:hypothetical protein
MKTGDEVVLCIATQPQGHAFVEELVHHGCRVTIFALEELREADWPAGVEIETMPGGMSQQQICNAIAYLARSRNFVRIFALTAADALTAAGLREHMRVAGMGQTRTRYFTDVVAMRAKAAHAGIRVPAFTLVLNYDILRNFLREVPAPWRLQPRAIGHASDARILEEEEPLWRALDELGDRQSDYFVEQAIPGELLAAGGICVDGKLRYNAMYTDAQDSAAGHGVLAMHAKLVPALGMTRGAVHSRFLLSSGSGSLYFLETAPVPAGAADSDLWREWGRLEADALRGK